MVHVCCMIIDMLDSKVYGESTSTRNQLVFGNRISWTPDGGQLGVARGYQKKQWVSPVYDRNSWKNLMRYLGHKKPTTVTVCYMHQTITVIAIIMCYVCVNSDGIRVYFKMRQIKSFSVYVLLVMLPFIMCIN
jgi:hypothetical protein